jgi:predicted GNAT family N-acyltransferase
MSGGFGPANDQSSGTEFLSIQAPPRDAVKDYDPNKRHDQQTASIPQIFRDAMFVREAVFVDEQNVPLEVEFDEDDHRSWHWVVYASVATSSNSASPTTMSAAPANTYFFEQRRPSATARRLPVGTIRLVPPPHGPNKYIEGDRHPDADPPDSVMESISKKHPKEPYIKFGRLAVLSDYRGMGLSKLLINTAIEYAAKHPEAIRPPPSPTSLEFANQLGNGTEACLLWQGLIMVHAQVSVLPLWQKHGFAEELRDEQGNIEISKEEHWMEEGIEHVGLWKRLKLDSRS